MTKKYLSRTIERNLLDRAKEFPVIVLTGPRQTGKSTMLKKIFPSYNYVSFDDPLVRNLAAQDPSLFLENNPAPLIVDEIQYVPEILPFLKMEADKDRSKNGLYILTGSQMFELMSGISESLAGRAALHELMGFSFEEISNGLPKRSTDECFHSIFKGFFPEPCIHNIDLNTFYGSYIQTYLERDIRQIRSVHDLRLFQQFLELLAARCGSILNLNEISKECGISHTTAQKWLSLLESTRIVYLLRSYHKNVTKRVIKRPKLYFTDTGLLSYILKYSDHKTLRSGPMAGNVFENMLVMEVLKYKFNYNRRFELYYYRDSNHNEIDLVLDFGATLRLMEFKLTKSLREEHWKTLSRLKDVFQAHTSYLLSFHPKTIKVADNVTAAPWWKLYDLLK